MTNLAVQVVLHYKTNLPRDVSVNTFAFTAPSGDEDVLTAITDAMATFYNSPVQAGGNALGYWIGKWVSRTSPSMEVKIYNMDQAKPRPPVSVVELELAAPGGPSGLPLEVAATMSFSGDPVAGTPAARRRGRIFFGPLQASAVDGTQTSTPPRLHFDLMSDLRKAALRLAGTTEEGIRWCVHSRTSGQYVPITRGWIDNEPDTQRRRGMTSTSREVWSLDV